MLTFIPCRKVERASVCPGPLPTVLRPPTRPIVAEEPDGSPLVSQEGVRKSVVNGHQVASEKLATVPSVGPDLLGRMKIVAVVEARPLH